MEYDVVIIGAGPAGLSAAIKIKQLAAKANQAISVCILEKGAQVGSHIISGAALDPRSLIELFPETWQEAPLDTPAKEDFFYFLTKEHALKLMTPKQLSNKGNYIISLGELCRYLATKAESLGCEIYPGFPAVDLIIESEQVKGVVTGSFGINKQGEQTENFQPGMHLLAKYTLVAEGCRGQLSQILMQRFNLREHSEPQTYGLGIKEIWRIRPEVHERGKIIHTIGWPMDSKTYGGSFIYFFSESRISIGFAVGLDYSNPWLNPFEEMQRFKTHPFVRSLLSKGERIAYGARAINEGGWQSLPKLTFPGGVLIGDGAGFLNVPKIKGIHTAMKSGILAAESCVDGLLCSKAPAIELDEYSEAVKSSWLGKELKAERNIRPGFKYGLFLGLANAFLETYITRGKSPWTLKPNDDPKQLKLAKNSKEIIYPTPDGILTFDKLSSVFLTNTYHEGNQPPHLILKNPAGAIGINYQYYKSPETRYCPAAVYEIIDEQTNPKLQINAQNCIHCKTCDIKDPEQNIIWTAPEGSGGPNYIEM